VCLSDVTHHHVLAVPHVRARLQDLLTEYASSFSTDPEEIERLHGAVAKLAGLLGAVQPESQVAVAEILASLRS
jgi:hypothetical protein